MSAWELDALASYGVAVRRAGSRREIGGSAPKLARASSARSVSFVSCPVCPGLRGAGATPSRRRASSYVRRPRADVDHDVRIDRRGGEPRALDSLQLRPPERYRHAVRLAPQVPTTRRTQTHGHSTYNHAVRNMPQYSDSCASIVDNLLWLVSIRRRRGVVRRGARKARGCRARERDSVWAASYNYLAPASLHVALINSRHN